MILYLSEINKKEEINVSIDDDDVTVTIETTNSEELVTPLKVKIDPSKGVDIDIENGMVKIHFKKKEMGKKRLTIN
ncbi:1015_t:CDS:2 [Entrophospora sp. SA101]|nr:1015_t:CDS:2 [Entrophospora sp. SA101]CAJ0918241.1 5612_t:CDS:2 [Entrophospora sp. SA101]